MRRDLEDTVRRCVNDQRPCMQMLLPVIMDDLGTRVGLVAQNLVAGLCRKSIQQLLWETFGECRQWIGGKQASDFPVSNRGIFAGAGFPQPRIAPNRAFDRRSAVDAINVEQT